MTKKEQNKKFNYWLAEIESEIETATRNEMPAIALLFSGEAIGFVRLAYYLDIIDMKELDILIDKFYNYYNLYYFLIYDKN